MNAYVVGTPVGTARKTGPEQPLGNRLRLCQRSTRTGASWARSRASGSSNIRPALNANCHGAAIRERVADQLRRGVPVCPVSGSICSTSTSPARTSRSMSNPEKRSPIASDVCPWRPMNSSTSSSSAGMQTRVLRRPRITPVRNNRIRGTRRGSGARELPADQGARARGGRQELAH